MCVQISSITVITLKQQEILTSLTATIKSTVLIYVSQISIVESAKLEVSGALVFPGAPAPITDISGIIKNNEMPRIFLNSL